MVVVLPELKGSFQVELATLVWVLLFGHYLEARASMTAGDSLSQVAKLLPHHAYVYRGSKLKETMK